MLTWIQRSDGWYSNGYRIELAAPFRWLLFESMPEPSQVRIMPAPLATARTFTECKREAELRAIARGLSDSRRKWAAQLVFVVLVFGGIVFAFGAAPPWDSFASIGLLGLAMRPLGLLVGSFGGGFDGRMYQ